MKPKLKNTNVINIKSPILTKDIDINKIVVSKFPFDKQNFKYFIGYKD